jgi:hypothetical protein
MEADKDAIALELKREEIKKNVEEARKLQDAGKLEVAGKETKLQAAESAGIFIPFNGKGSWKPEQAVEWEAELAEFQASQKCKSCGSNQITRHLRGRPYMPYVEWHQQKSVELGWTTLTLAGCTNPGGTKCAACGKDPNVE